jgi:dipeptidyl aminopeptidase/acylaminoacyl peptidase
MFRRFSSKILLALVLIAASLIGVAAYQRLNYSEEISSIIDTGGEQSQAEDDAAQLAYEELTIPYLRAREYQSSLSDIKIYQEKGTYTSFLTSYESDGLTINGLLTKPAGEMPAEGWPAVVFVHGYIPPAQYQTTTRYGDYVDYLASRGLVVFKIDLRGHGSSKGTTNGAYYSSDYIVDTLNAVAALANADFVNEKKIGLWGHSMAGNVVLRSMAAKPELGAAVIWAGAGFTYNDLQKYGISDNSYRRPTDNSQRQRFRDGLIASHGHFDQANIFWQQVSPVNYLGDLQGAIQLHHAADDSVVNIGYSRDLRQLLAEAGVRHQFFEYANGGHNINNGNFGIAMQRTVEFFQENL